MNEPSAAPTETQVSDQAAAFSAALDATSDKATVPRQTLFTVLDQLRPDIDGAAAKRATLAAILDELTEQATITTPKDRQRWDAGRPPLPATIRLRRPSTKRTKPPAMVWRPELSWASATTLTPNQIGYIQDINRWLRDTTATAGQEPIPMRERSHEIFGDEKRLETLLTTSLFAPGRLTLNTLRCQRLPVPLAVRTTSDHTTLLVVENSDTFHSLWRIFKERPGTIGHLAYGSGKAFESAVADIANLSKIERILYFGDLDPAGLSIPKRASHTATALGLPAIEPATVLYTELLKHQPNASQAIDHDHAERLAQWLPQDLRASTLDYLCKGKRIAQEALNYDHLSQLRELADFGK